MAKGLVRRGDLPDPQRRPAPEILRPRDVPLSVGPHPYGARAQLRHGRRGGALHAGEGVQRPPPDGLGRLRPAGRERRPRSRGASRRVDLRQYRRHARTAAIDGAVARLEPRDRHLRSGLLQAPAASVPGFPRSRPRRPPHGARELGSGRPDRPRQRAGHRRPRLALGRARRAARADPVVPEDHRLRAGPSRRARPARALAREGPADAEELDRPLGRAPGPLRARSRLRRRRARASSTSTRRAPTRCSAPASWRWRPTIRSPAPPPRGIRRSPPSSRSAGAPARPRRRSRRPRSSATIPASAPCIRSTRIGRCRSMSPISSSWITAPAPSSAARRTTSATSTSSTNTASATRRWYARPAPIRRPSRSPTPPMTATAA